MIQISRTCSRWIVAVVALMLTGCASSSDIPGMVNPREVDLSRVRSHVETLNSPDLEGRETGRLGGARASAYVSGVLRSNRLQPALENEYRWLYPLQKPVLEHASLHVVQEDTLRLIPGTAFVVDHASGSGTWSGAFGPGERPLDVLNRGIRVDPDGLRPGPMTSIHAPLRLGLLPPARTILGRRVSREGSVHVQVRISEELVSGIHVLGFLPGSHPVRRDTLVVVMARYDGYGVQGAGTWTDGTDSGLDAAVLLETARTLAVAQNLDRSIPFSVLFAFVSGVTEACQGMRWLEDHLPWERDAIQRVILLGSLDACVDASSSFPQTTTVPAPDGWWMSGVRIASDEASLIPRQDVLTRDRTARLLPAANVWIQETTRSILQPK